MRLTKLALLLALVVPAFAQFGSNATHLRGKPLCSPLTLTDGWSLSWNAAGGCYQNAAAAAGSVVWGSILGTLANQTDLNTALGLKAPLASPTITGHPTIEGVTSTGATGTGKFVFDTGATITGYLPTGSAVFSDTDALCAVTGGTCPAGSVVATANTEAGFAHNVALAQNVPGTNKAVRVTYGFWTSVQGGPPPTVTFTLRACLTANFTTGAAVACSSGGVVLWLLATTVNGLGDISGSDVTDGSFTLLIQGGGSGILYVTNTARSGGAFTDATGRIFTTMTTNPKTSSVPMTAGAWTLYMTAKFSGATASNWIQQINGPVVETIN
jgi:hypothetical protein